MKFFPSGQHRPAARTVPDIDIADIAVAAHMVIAAVHMVVADNWSSCRDLADLSRPDLHVDSCSVASRPNHRAVAIPALYTRRKVVFVRILVVVP